ncbi:MULTISPECIES: FAD-dependent oxidoreductase [unclassified Dietzia]|uniref:FAD-dependent oxidoreductase n=2 Tax=Dietzia TaxID=37914 RepID=UPI000D22554B|nr:MULTISPECIES: FAD-dependent oxidoreductase [unclassified Dietzia]AVZ40769.1 4Fe-4S ferredoxin [Dietzia sp. JS16-p6b]QGW26365.1 putative ferredoxin reductase [Dietzia sp. DQ12-45-1b]
MPHVVTQACCADASCVHACPVNCIHPTPDEPDFATAEMLYIDPDVCVDCGACVGACPVGAIVPDDRLTPGEQVFLDLNAVLSTPSRPYPPQAPVPPIRRLERDRGRAGHPLRVAIVGAGPAALYTADELLRQSGVEVTVFDRLPVPHGLARHGVAPDHARTRSVTDLFTLIENQSGFTYRLGVEIGRDLGVGDLAAHHDAVVYATGASTDRPLDIPGTGLPGSMSATQVVSWYNGHPDHVDARVPLDHERAVIVGNGNVALDVARILATPAEALAGSDISPVALEALRSSRVREIVVLGRRGPAQAAFTLPELVGLASRDDIDLRVEAPGGIDPRAATDRQRSLMLECLADVASRPPRPGSPRIVLRFQSVPVEVLGGDRVEGLRIAETGLTTRDGDVRAVPRPGTEEVLDAGLVLRSVGYRGVPVPGVPFDPATGTIPHRGGRVLDRPGGSEVPGSYVVGWIKRGPRGFIGSNKTCARETVDALLADANAGRLPRPVTPSGPVRTSA